MFKTLCLISSVFGAATITFDPASVCEDNKKDAECLIDAETKSTAFTAHLVDDSAKFTYDETCGYSADYKDAAVEGSTADFNIEQINIEVTGSSCEPVVFITDDETKCSDDSAKLAGTTFADKIISGTWPTPEAGQKIYVAAGDDDACFTSKDGGEMTFQYIFKYDAAVPADNESSTTSGPSDASTETPADTSTSQTDGVENRIAVPLAAALALVAVPNLF